jgi:nickel-dependent lactate racemase
MELKYGDSFVNIELPDHIEWRVLQQDAPFFLSDEMHLVRQGVDNLVEQLRSRLSSKGSVLLIVPDHTRKCNLPSILPELIKRLKQDFQAQIKILIANGSHAQQPEETIIDLVTPEIYQRYPTIQHDSLQDEQLVYLGQTTNGTDVRLNKLVAESDFVITIGGMLYHYFAGFGGGPKMLLPGVAAYETIRQNHSRTIDTNGQFHPFAQNGNISTNPVYEDLSQVLNFVPNVLSLQVVLSPQGKIAFCEAGPIIETQQKLIPKVKELYSISVDEKSDIVIASAGGFPSDVNLIQSHKSIHHAFQAVKENGILVIFARCREGIGSKTFLPYFEYSSSKKIGQALSKEFKINGQTALALREKAEKSQIYFISDLEAEIVERIGMIPCQSFADMPLDFLFNKKGAIMPHANITVPL